MDANGPIGSPVSAIAHDNCLDMILRYPLVNIQKAIENGPVEIVDLPIK